MAAGLSAIAAWTSISSLRRTRDLGAELAEIVEEVVGEAVVVVDQQQHLPGAFRGAFRLAPRRSRAIHGPGAETGSRASGARIGGSRGKRKVMQRARRAASGGDPAG